MKAKILLINLVFVSLLSGCSYLENVFKEPDMTKGLTAQQIYGQGKEFLDAQDYPNAIKYFDILEARYPFGVYSTQAMLDLAFAAYQSNLKDEAIVNCDRFIRLYPNHPNVSYAYYLRALANFDKDANFITKLFAQDASRYDVSKLKMSFDDFTVVVNKFPNSKYAKDSRNRLLYIRNMIAANELYIAEYYSKRSAHVATIERVKYLIKNYRGSSSAEDGLLLLIKSYNNLNMHDLAYDSARVLKKNYPEYTIDNSGKNIIVTKNLNNKKNTIDTQKSEKKSWVDYLNIFDYF